MESASKRFTLGANGLPVCPVDDVKRLRLLDQENTRLRKILAERDLEIEIMKEIAATKW
jgi:hypothetical protein